MLFPFAFILASNLFAQKVKFDTLLINGPNNQTLSPYYLSWEDRRDTASLQTVLNELASNRFSQPITQKSGVFNSKLTNSSFWFALSIKNTTLENLDLLWSFYNNNIGLVLYDITSAKDSRFVDSLLPYETIDKREFQTRALSFRFQLKGSQTNTFLLKVYKVNTDEIYFPSDITTVEDFLLWESDYSFLMGRYIGYFCFVLVFNIFFWIFLKSNTYMWNALYILFVILYSFTENMFDVLYFPDWLYPWFNKIPKMAFLQFAVLAGMVVTQRFTLQRKVFKRFYYVFNLYKFIGWMIVLLLVASSIVLPYWSRISSILRITNDILFFIGVLLVLIYTVYGAVKKDKLCIAQLLAILCLELSYIDYFFVNIFDIQFFYFRPGNILIGLAIEIGLLSVFISIKINKKEKNQLLELQNKSAENLALTANLIVIQEEERNRIARDLHDDIGATLSTLLLLISNSSNTNSQQLISIVSKATNDLRRLAHNLMPQGILENGLFGALSELNEGLRKQTLTNFTFTLLGNDHISPEKSLHIFRIINEAIANILKHSIASKAYIQVYAENKLIRIMIEDNGIGFNNEPKPNGLGIQNIQTRAAYLKGQVTIDSNSNGTTVVINIPN